MITKLVGEKHDRKPDLLETVTLAYNSTIHSATGYCLHEHLSSCTLQDGSQMRGVLTVPLEVAHQPLELGKKTSLDSHCRCRAAA